jgi:hypothetical protein
MKTLTNESTNNHKNASTHVNANTRSTIIQQCIYKRAVSHSQRSKRVHLCTKKHAYSPTSQTSRWTHTHKDSRCTCSNIPVCTRGHAHIHTHKCTHSCAHNTHTHTQALICADMPMLPNKWAYTQTQMCITEQAHAHVLEYTNMHEHTNTPTQGNQHVCTNMHIHSCTHWHTCANEHTAP